MKQTHTKLGRSPTRAIEYECTVHAPARGASKAQALLRLNGGSPCPLQFHHWGDTREASRHRSFSSAMVRTYMIISSSHLSLATLGSTLSLAMNVSFVRPPNLHPTDRRHLRTAFLQGIYTTLVPPAASYCYTVQARCFLSTKPLYRTGIMRRSR